MNLNEQFKHPKEEEKLQTNATLHQVVDAIVVDRAHAKKISGEAEKEVVFDIYKLIERMNADESEKILTHLQYAEQLNGHRGAQLRMITTSGTSELSGYFQKLHSLTSDFLRSDGVEDALRQLIQLELPTGLQSFDATSQSEYTLPQYLAVSELSADESENYEAMLLHKTADVLGVSRDKPKWNDMVSKAFTTTNTREVVLSLLTAVGSIPEQLMNRRKFKNSFEHQPQSVLDVIQALRSIEHDDATPRLVQRTAQYERAKVLNYMIQTGVAESLRAKKDQQPNMTLDTNGVFLKLRGFESHIPYGLLDKQTLTTLDPAADTKTAPWVSQAEFDEIVIQNAGENSDVSRMKAAQELQFSRFADHSKNHVSDIDSEELSAETFAQYARNHPEKTARLLLQENVILPDTVIEAMLRDQDGRCLYESVRLGEAIGQQLLQQTNYFDAQGFFDYNLDATEQEAQQTRTTLLNDPRHFSAMKIVSGVLNAQQRLETEEHFALVAGKAKKKRGQKQKYQRTYIEAMYEGGTARILINEEKHLSPLLRKALDQLIQVPVEHYAKVAQKAQTLHYFGKVVRTIESIAQQDSATFEAVEPALRDVQYYLSADFSAHPHHYKAANEFVEQYAGSDDIPATALLQLVSQLQAARQAYADYFYTVIKNPELIPEHFNPHVETITTSYTPDILTEQQQQINAMKEIATRSRSGVSVEDEFDPSLYVDGFDAKNTITVMDYPLDSRSDTPPHNVLMKHLQAIGIEPGHPVISVLGGCRNVDGTEAMQGYASAIVEAGIATKANVAIPPLQSGMPVPMALAYRSLQQRYEQMEVPPEERMHMFTVGPGPNLVFPGNKYTNIDAMRPVLEGKTNAPEAHVYGLVPVPAIITPTDGEWWRQGNAKLDSPYFIQIAYQAALYELLSRDQREVTTVGNGGYYTLIEMSQQLPRGFHHFILQDTGRFAEHFAELFRQLDSFALDDITLVTKEDFVNPETAKQLQFIYDQMMDIFEHSDIDPKVIQEFLQKDFGTARALPELSGTVEQVRLEDYEINRKMIVKILQQAQQRYDQIKMTTRADLEQDLLDHLL